MAGNRNGGGEERNEGEKKAKALIGVAVSNFWLKKGAKRKSKRSLKTKTNAVNFFGNTQARARGPQVVPEASVDTGSDGAKSDQVNENTVNREMGGTKPPPPGGKLPPIQDKKVYPQSSTGIL